MLNFNRLEVIIDKELKFHILHCFFIFPQLLSATDGSTYLADRKI